MTYPTTLTYPKIFCECGWLGKPGEGIPCDSPVTGPWFCPKCSQPLDTYKVAMNTYPY